MAPRLALAYNPTVPPALLEAMEIHGRALGLPLATLEWLGQTEARCAYFLSVAERGDHAALEAVLGIRPASPMARLRRAPREPGEARDARPPAAQEPAGR